MTNVIDISKERRPSPGVLVGCCPSSGSTLLGVLLDAHPELYCGPELTLFAHPFIWQLKGDLLRARLQWALGHEVDLQDEQKWNLASGAVPYAGLLDGGNLSWYGSSLTMIREQVVGINSGAELAELLLGKARDRVGKKIWLEKSPPNLYAASSFLEACSEARVLLIVRDGRDVACSLIKRGFSIGEAAAIWLLETGMARALSGHPRVYVVRYEDLIERPLEALTEICRFLGAAPYTQAILDAYLDNTRVRLDPSIRVATWQSTPADGINRKSLGRWKRDLSGDDLAVLMAHRLTGVDVPGCLPLNATDITFSAMLEAFRYEKSPVYASSWSSMLSYYFKEEHPMAWMTHAARLHRNFVRFTPESAAAPKLPLSWSEFEVLMEQLYENGDPRHLVNKVGHLRDKALP